MTNFNDKVLKQLDKNIQDATNTEIYTAIANVIMDEVAFDWSESVTEKRACYLSAEFLIGRIIDCNLYNLDLISTCEQFLEENNLSLRFLEDIDDNALGNGGLGRLAACFLDSAATHKIALDGYGIRYRYGIFKQKIENGYQVEYPDDWMKFGDYFSIRKESEKEIIEFKDQKVFAVPYDMPIIGYKKACINTLRLWQAEPVEEDYNNEDKCNKALEISNVLYPNDNDDEGKKLRLKQQYFFSGATIKHLIKQFKEKGCRDFNKFSDYFAIQLNDTHPTVAILEFIRILVEEEDVSFDDAFKFAVDTFAYTNHTIMEEALEKWRVDLFVDVVPQLYKYVEMINERLLNEINTVDDDKFRIINNNLIHMARLAIYVSHSVNGVAKIHTEIIKNTVLPHWHKKYPNRFNNKTNGITQRRWLGCCNPELSRYITSRIGDKWIKDLYTIKQLEDKTVSDTDINEFVKVKLYKKHELKEYIEKRENIFIDETSVMDIQIKRIHEYKRQLLNAFSVLDIYFGIREGRLLDFPKTTFIIGGKSAPGYKRAKAIIKYINDIANKINNDTTTNDIIKLVFVSDYNVSYAQKLIPAADISEQISTAGTEASGTSNMKFMLNGAVTLGTLDGANIEIVNKAGAENNYIFGATVEDIKKLENSYNPKSIYEQTPRLKRVVDTLIDGTFKDDGDSFKELYDSLLVGASWHKPDNYYLFYDFLSYTDTRIKAIYDTKDKISFYRKCLLNISNAGEFSSDRTIKEYAKEIWKI